MRLATRDDAAAIAAIYRPIVEATTISFEESAPTDDEMRARIERTLTTYPWIVLDQGDGVRAYAYGGRWRERAAYRRSVEVTVYVREDARGRGAGAAAYAALFRVLAAQGFRRAYGGITLPNDASEALHRAAGFTPVGVYHEAGFKLGRWCDVAWYERALSDSAAVPPPEPIPLPQLAPAALARALGG